MNKKYLVFALVAMVLLAGCGLSNPVSSKVSSSQAAEQVSSGASVSQAVSAPASSSVLSSAPVPENSFAGKYICASEHLEEIYFPSITLQDSGAFSMGVNLYEGMGTVEGTWEESEDALRMTVTKRDFAGFLGDNVDAFTFIVQDENTLVYEGDDIGVTTAGDSFARAG